MKDESEEIKDDSWTGSRGYSSKRQRNRSADSKSFRILAGILLVLFFFGGIFYFLSRKTPGVEVAPLEAKLLSMEQKMVELEKQLTELQGKVTPQGTDPGLLQRVDALAQKIERLEKQKPLTTDLKAKPSAPLKPAESSEKRYHKVQKGDTLNEIARKYGVSVQDLRKLNNLPADKPLRVGQKLVVSNGR